MNYLAHFHLADQLAGSGSVEQQQGLMIGALLGDYVKGPLRGDYPANWETGIWLHRRIDALTDRHPLVQECLQLLPEAYRRFGGIMLDVCFDHCLANRWQDFDQRELTDFSQHCYKQVLPHSDRYPQLASRQIGILSRHNVLSMMTDWQRVEQMLAGIGSRLRVSNPLAECGPSLYQNLADIDTRFQELYPALVAQLTTELAAR
ncbi:DUF479 domain-containing protein [Spongiibacter sp. KMU-158]|uniref:DUF479 domain-containing protein n=1 Tax=Spongiibacter pelagi TaxID=2760804 RepID=A0A927C006_9GAMM|nr:ACP phosphodiesterase [Spongiibacter pelagi]MBD2857663.1 DUF479 domain-containing protein [Spongiibacter pelagi]